MFVGITNTPRDYAWGSTTAISGLLGTPASGSPEAELWLGTHPGSPSALTDGSGDLRGLVGELPFLLKVLAAAHPLSLQAHPTIEQAVVGFARENALGIAVDAPNRNYRDELHKPELILALSDDFRALCGFRPVTETRASLERLLQVSPGDAALSGLLARLSTDDAIRPTFEWLVSRGEGVAELVAAVVQGASRTDSPHFTLVTELHAEYPGDPGVVVSLLLNLVTLRRGEVLYLPAGNIHAYVEGLGIELMAASDNVLRGGLTPKHVDVPELLSVLDFTPVPVPYLAGISQSPGLTVFRPPVPDFELLHVTGDTVLPLRAGAIALCTEGAFTLGSFELARGESVYISADEAPVVVTGQGELFVATSRG
ncbi:mannose-6-phosphate isomerase, class I [Glaciihabitans arcticus]|uniref:mannose-6-phosphate isomerase n=1 Tax=Glaciihabitans arcticus TaxID=2668039 RepID=A0A4Q9GPW2_9MICO|nr:mannose-6-phosphate isomerase, class I [Glaciihabitans arcticus]TBN55974.1 mannose-6-phosphate isomerase, class I [Glaciihabitans arcticus]